MNGTEYLLDTNIVLYLIGGKIKPNAFPTENLLISFITELEILSYSYISDKDRESIQKFLDEISIIDINKEIKEQTVRLRRSYNL